MHKPAVGIFCFHVSIHYVHYNQGLEQAFLLNLPSVSDELGYESWLFNSYMPTADVVVTWRLIPGIAVLVYFWANRLSYSPRTTVSGKTFSSRSSF